MDAEKHKKLFTHKNWTQNNIKKCEDVDWNEWKGNWIMKE